MSPDELAALRRDVEYLKGRLAILDCISRHSRGDDRHDTDLITGGYHDDGVDEHGAAVNPASRYAEWINAVHAAGSQVHTHNITPTRVTLTATPLIVRATCWYACSTMTG